VALVAYGEGATGKSTLTSPILDVLGSDLCGSAGLDELCKSGSYALASLKGKMLNRASELNGTEIPTSGNFKAIVSGEPLNVRQIYSAPEEMQTSCKLLFLTNHYPRFKHGTDAEARRLRILHFQVKPATKDVKLKDKLKAELSGVLNWMVEGLVWVLQHQKIPDGGVAAKNVKESFERANDPVGSFLNECCTFGPGQSVSKSDLYESFGAWAEEAALCPGQWENFFFKGLRQRHPELREVRKTVANGRERCLVGVGLIHNEAASQNERWNTPVLLAKLDKISEARSAAMASG
jgi:putative DNA primase/helicase